jgi:hypothetical protein
MVELELVWDSGVGGVGLFWEGRNVKRVGQFMCIFIENNARNHDRKIIENDGLAWGQFLSSWKTISVNYDNFFHVCTCIFNEDYNSSEKCSNFLFALSGMNKCQTRQLR